MTDRELDAAGITEPALRDAYRRCRKLNARHGRTYFLATRLLPVERLLLPSTLCTASPDGRTTSSTP